MFWDDALSTHPNSDLRGRRAPLMDSHLFCIFPYFLVLTFGLVINHFVDSSLHMMLIYLEQNLIGGREVCTYVWSTCHLTGRGEIFPPRRPIGRLTRCVLPEEDPSNAQVSLRKRGSKRGEKG